MSNELATKLVDHLATYGSCAVAMSAGVDSTVVAQAAYLALGDQSVAVTAVSASLAEGEQAMAEQLAGQIGIRHEVIHTEELSDERYRANDGQRCYYCKTELYGRLLTHLTSWKIETVANGANIDDLSDYRPGMQAAAEQKVRSPLIECKMGKRQIRQLAAHWQLPVWNKPASPCLSSRIAYGLEVTPERLRRVDRAESWLRARGYGQLRVRYHPGDMARIEVLPEKLMRLCEPGEREQVIAYFQELGFQQTTIDLSGFRSGNMNLVLIDQS